VVDDVRGVGDFADGAALAKEGSGEGQVEGARIVWVSTHERVEKLLLSAEEV
jgi:hypothetical protein